MINKNPRSSTENYIKWLDENTEFFRKMYQYSFKISESPDWNPKFVSIEFNQLKSNPYDIVIEQHWNMGGTRGSCYSDEKYPVSGEIKPEFDELDAIVEMINPNISFMQYKRKVIPLIKNSTSSDRDYYGGSTEFGHEYVNLYELWRALNEL